MIFTREENSRQEKSQNGKNPTKLEIIYGTEGGQTGLKRRKKKSNREKDYGRLRSVDENERKVQKKKNEKRRLN